MIAASLASTTAVAVFAATAAATPAEELVDSSFGYIAEEGHDPKLPTGVQTSPDIPGQRFLKFENTSGRTVHAFAFGPFAFQDADGQVRSIDTDLVAIAGGWRPKSVPFSVTLPTLLETGVIWQDAGTGSQVRIYPQNVHNSPGHLMAGTSDTVIYEDAWNRSHMTLAVTAEGVKDHIIITQANGAPNHFKFRVERPNGARTLLDADGGIRVVGLGNAVLAQLPAPVARDRDFQEFEVWYEVAQHANFDVIELHYDTTAVTAEGGTVTYEAPFDLDPAIYSGSIVYGVNAFRETSLNAYTVSDVVNGNLRARLLKPLVEAPAVPTYPTGTFAKWWITSPPEGSRWHNFSARVEGSVGVTQKYTLFDDSGVKYTFGPAPAAGTFFAQDVSFKPAGFATSIIEATAASTPLFDYGATLTNAVALYEDLVDPVLTDLRPNNSTITTDEVTLSLGMQDGQSGCASITVTLHGPAAPIGTRSGSGCNFAPLFNLRTEGVHRISAVLTDRSGRQTTASGAFTFDSPIDPPQPPVVDGTNVNADADWTNQGTAFSATWNIAEGATSYQLCFTASSSCAADDRWTGFGATSGTVGGYVFRHGELVQACVRSITSDGIRTTPTCSDGVRVDAVPPHSPARVDDGMVAGVDSERTLSTFEAAATWPDVSDDGSGVAGYEACVTYVGSQCAEAQWFEREPVENLSGLSTIERYVLTLGSTYTICVRAYDVVENVSSGTCSDGQRVNPSVDEIEQNIVARMQLGLNHDADFVRSILRDPPADGVSDRYGFTASQQEAAYLATLFAVQDSMSDKVEAFREDLPESFGGTYIDPESGTTVVNLAKPAPRQVATLLGRTRASCRNAVVRTRSIRAHASRGKRKARAPRCEDSVILRRVRYTENVLSTIQGRIFEADAPAILKTGIRVTSASIDPVGNVLKVGIEPGGDLGRSEAQKFLNHFYSRFKRDKLGPIRVEYRELRRPQARPRPRPDRVNFFGKHYLAGGVLTGSYIGGEVSECTAGFPLPGSRRLLSADHCFEKDGVHREVFSSGLRIGLTGARYVRAYKMDLRWVDLDPGVDARSAIFRRFPAPVTQDQEPAQGPVMLAMPIAAGRAVAGRHGEWLCQSTRSDGVFTRTGQSCAVVFSVNASYRLEGYGDQEFIGTSMASNKLFEGQPFTPRRGRFISCGGDSGGPIYRVVGGGYGQARMVGIVSSGDPERVVNVPHYPRGECTADALFSVIQRAGY